MKRKTGGLKPVDPQIVALAQEHGGDPENMLAIFQRLQAQHGGLSREDITGVARALGIPAERAGGLATFYSMLTPLLTGDGQVEHPATGPVLRICDGPACWLRG